MYHRLLRSFLPALLLLLTSPCFSQNIDSLWTLRKDMTLSDTTRIGALMQIILAEYMYTDTGEVLLNTGLEESLKPTYRQQRANN
jgi:hypothetical protein